MVNFHVTPDLDAGWGEETSIHQTVALYKGNEAVMKQFYIQYHTDFQVKFIRYLFHNYYRYVGFITVPLPSIVQNTV